ncbi:diguanylate cyclase [Aestuariibacter sp. AA17]|uniref:diguanylate cyclase n=1 Tax=Fluctibacter corallii TaxID=2984329 RepID=A0ABT3ADA2_9ALTE|nr:response regulator [Aestuariibacter sp. AA17]MCV2886231.1 diguanylate cyclase [Aestuariibacter sp. AA17]
MKHKVLLIEDSHHDMRLLKRVIGKANLEVVSADSLTRAKIVFADSEPEQFLCAVVEYTLPDAPRGEAIDFALSAYLPVIAITSGFDEDIRDNILQRDVVDYVPKENAQMYEYMSRLLFRLEKNKNIGVLITHPKRAVRASILSILRRHNFQIFESTSASDAESLVQTLPQVKLLLVSDQLKEGAGIDLVASLRKVYSKEELAIVGLIENPQEHAPARFIKGGANDYLTFPYAQEAFLCRVMLNVEYIEHIDTIKQVANTDYLTGLPNRRHFFDKVNAELKRDTKHHCLALIDLDHFKDINDTLGHDAGDEVLKAVGSTLKQRFPQDIIARFGGEEFCVFMADTSLEDAEAALSDFKQQCKETPIQYAGTSLRYTMSVGLTRHFRDNIESMLKIADIHLYHAKETGRDKVVSDLDHHPDIDAIHSLST